MIFTDGAEEFWSVSNVHGYGDNHAAVSVFRQAKTRDVHISGVFYKRDQQRLWGVEEACPKAEGVVLDLQTLETEKILVEHVFADTARVGVCVTGKANAEIRDFHINKASDYETICGSSCTAIVNGETVPVTESLEL